MRPHKKAKTANALDTQFIDLPDDCLNEISHCLNDKSWAALSASCIKLHGLFSHDLIKRKANYLMRLILEGDEVNVLKIIQINPALLFEENCQGMDFAMDEFGKRRIITGTPFRALLGAFDTDLLGKMMPYLGNYQREMFDQYQRQFPDGFPEQPSFDYDLRSLLDEIKQDPCTDYKVNTATEVALEAFRSYVRLLSSDQVLHFDLRIIHNASSLLDNEYNNLSAKQKGVYRCQVLGYLQRFVSSCDAQAMCYGLGFFRLNNGMPLEKRSFVLKNDVPYFGNVSGRVGFGFDSYFEPLESFANGPETSASPMILTFNLCSYILLKIRSFNGLIYDWKCASLLQERPALA